MKKTNKIKTRIIATVLSAITVCSVGTVALTSASAASNTVSAGTTITDDYSIKLDSDLNAVKNLTSSTIFKVLEECTGWGKFVTPALGGLLDSFVGTEDQTAQKLDEISDKIDKLFDRIDSLESSMKTAFTTELGINSFYNKFIEFKSQTRAMQKKIDETLVNTKLSNADKMAKIASLTGNYSEWRAKFEDVLGSLNELFKQPVMTRNNNIFELSYNHYTNTSLLSGEAIDKAKPVCDYVMSAYSAGCATIMESLSAQLYVNALPEKTQAAINKDFSAHICRDADDVAAEIKEVSEYSVKTSTEISGFRDKDGNFYDRADTQINGVYYKYLTTSINFLGVIMSGGVKMIKVTPVYKTVLDPNTFMRSYQKTFDISRCIYLDKGNSNIAMSNKLNVLDHTNNPHANGKWSDDAGKNTADWFNNTLAGDALNGDKIKALANDASSKGITLRTLLDQNGFDTSNLPQNTNLVTEGARNDSVSSLSELVGYNYQRSFYKGINIDQVGASERTIQLIDCGVNIWKNDRWNYAYSGNACVFKLA